LNFEKFKKIVYILCLIVVVVLVAFTSIWLFQSLRPFILVAIFSILGSIVAYTNLKAENIYKVCIYENVILILILMVSTRIGTLLATLDINYSFNPVDFILSFITYFGIATIVSLVIYYINEGEIKI